MPADGNRVGEVDAGAGGEKASSGGLAMDIYLLKDGRREGPFRVFQVKERLDRGETAPGEQGWHQGMESWRPLSEIDVLSTLLAPPAGAAAPVGENGAVLPEDDRPFRPEAPRTTPPPLPQNVVVLVVPLFPWRRLVARLFDASLSFGAMAGAVTLAGGMTAGEFLFPTETMRVALVLAWALIEAWMVMTWGTTPGKWLLGLNVRRLDGTLPTLGDSVLRSVIGWTVGWGLGIVPFTLIGWIVWYLHYRKTGMAWWDVGRNIMVTMGPLRTGRVVLCALFFPVYWLISLSVAMTAKLPDYMPQPEFRGKTLPEVFNQEMKRLLQEEQQRLDRRMKQNPV